MQTETCARRLLSTWTRRFMFVTVLSTGGLYLMGSAHRSTPSPNLLTFEMQEVSASLTGRDGVTKHFYDHVMEEFLHHDYQAAESGFRLFYALHGESPLAQYAQYMVGECALLQGRYEDAIASFDAVLSGSPLSHPLAAAALMKKGVSYEKLGDTLRSRQLLELVVTQFPDSAESKMARNTLRVPMP